MERFMRSGFIVRNGKSAQVVMMYDCTKLADIDYFLSAFSNEKEFKEFLKFGMNNSKIDIDNADVYIFSPGKGKNEFRYSDLIFNNSEAFLNSIERVRNGEKPNFYSTLNDSFQRYKRNEKYKLLFDSEYNRTYKASQDIIKNNSDKKNIPIRKPDWVKRSYTNYRDTVLLRDLYYENKNSKYEKMELLCERKKLIQGERDSINDFVTSKINYLNDQIDSKDGDRYLDFYLISPEEDLAEYYELNKDIASIDPSILDGFKVKRLSMNQLQDRKKFIIKTLMDEDILPNNTIEYDDNKNRFYLNIDKLVPECDEASKSYLNNKLTSGLLRKLKFAKTDQNRYDHENSTGFATSGIFELRKDMESSREDLEAHFDELIRVRNMKSFQKVFEFCLLLDSYKKEFGSGDKEKGNGRTK